MKRAGWSLLLGGLLLVALPFLSFFVLIISTGHQVQPGPQTIFYGVLYFCFVGGICIVPLGLYLLFCGLKLLR